MFAIGIDIGGTSIKGAVVNDTGKVLTRFAMDVNKDSSGEAEVNRFCDVMAKAINEYDKSIKLEGIGIGMPGILDMDKGVVITSPNLPKWNGLHISKLISKRMGLPVYINNDANVATLGEARFGSGKEYSNLIMLTLGTGVGGGIIIDNKLYDGNRHQGAELGHMVIRVNGEKCGCGRRGCFEAYASATGLIKMSKKEMDKNPDSLMHEVANEFGKVNAKVVFEASRRGDKAANRVMKRYVRYLGEGILNYCNIFRPEVVVLSGGVANEGDYLLDQVRHFLKNHSYGMKGSPKVELTVASLGYDSGKIGAACLVFDR